jgi:uncharacterized protein (TIGR03032 family)
MSAEAPVPMIAVGYTASPGFVDALVAARSCLLITTYQANQIVCVSATSAGVELSCLFVDRAMGIAVKDGVIAVGGRSHIWTLVNDPEMAGQLDPPGKYDACFQLQRSLFTGDFRCHEMAWVDNQLTVINTLFSCLCSLGPDERFIPFWRPPFLSATTGEDRCHLNGMAVEAGRVAYVTTLGETDTSQGWRPGKTTGGCVIDTASNAIIARGFCMPHSPRVSDGRLWLLNSGYGTLGILDRATGQFQPVARVPGYARGLAISGNVAFVGLSKIRASSTADGVPIVEQRDILRCGVAAIDLTTGKLLGKFEFTLGVDQIFDVTILPGFRRVALRKSATIEAR